MKITVFCGANNGRNEAYKENAIELGKWIADNNHSLVYGGGKVGLMGIIADTVLENNKVLEKKAELVHKNDIKTYYRRYV